MKRRSKVSGERIKARGRKTPERKRPHALKAAPRSNSSKETEVARLARELSEERRQRTATSEIIRLLSGSHTDLNRLFDAILNSATNLCQAKFGTLSLYEGDAFRIVAMHNAPAAFAELRRRDPLVRARPMLRMAETKQLLHVIDAQEYAASHPGDNDAAAFATLTGVRTVIGVPMLKEESLIGAFILYRQEVRPFTDKQIELVQNFAAQAVIAIENARLLNELRQRTDDLTERTADLTEALEQQTATSDLLQVISSSPGDLQPVFATMLEKAVRICDATFGNIYRWDRDALHLVAAHNTPPAFAEARRSTPFFSPGPKTVVGRMVATKTVIHVADLAAEQAYIKDRIPPAVAAVELGGVRTILAVPMLNKNELIGSFTVYRQEVRPFTDKQIDLVQNFAAQAVIAIENARLLNELRQSLEQQTATSEVLQVISSSPGDLEPVFQAMLENAVRICHAKFGIIYRWDSDALHLVASHNVPPAFADARRRSPRRPRPEAPTGRMIANKTVVHTANLAAEQTYIERDPDTVTSVEVGGVRSLLSVPMLKENELIGGFTLSRQEVRPFTDKQIELVKNFAAQAVIAIENARLLNELRQRTSDLTERTADLTEALEQQTATSEVLQVISTSPGNLEPVFAAMLEKAVRICDAGFGNVQRWGGATIMEYVASHKTPPAFAEARQRMAYQPDPEGFVSRMLRKKSVVQVADAASEKAYIEKRNPLFVAAVELGGVRTILLVPMLMNDEAIGMFSLHRQEVRPFTEKQIALVTNFANQAVIAIENARLLKELRDRTEDVEKLNRHLEQRVSDQVGEIERMGRLRRFLPPQVADLIVASGSEKQLESHRREITALFCDLRGFTGFTESADAEDVITLLREYHAAVGEKIIKYSGTLERYAGDGVMVVFNDPVPVDNPALQAVLMALEMRDAIGALTETWHRWGHDIGFGIGIAHGFATLGTIGFEGRFDYAAIGTVSNVASRLCDEAKPGQILISPRVLTKVENAVKVEPVGEFELKGIRRPLAAYNVVAAGPKN